MAFPLPIIIKTVFRIYMHKEHAFSALCKDTCATAHSCLKCKWFFSHFLFSPHLKNVSFFVLEYFYILDFFRTIAMDLYFWINYALIRLQISLIFSFKMMTQLYVLFFSISLQCQRGLCITRSRFFSYWKTSFLNIKFDV